VRPKASSLIPATVRPLSDHLPIRCVEDHISSILNKALFRFVAPFFHILVIGASPFPLHFGLFSALPASFVAAIGLPLRLFARQVGK
jgi:hypothetical protein